MLNDPIHLQSLLINPGLELRFVVGKCYSYLTLDNKLPKMYGTEQSFTMSMDSECQKLDRA